MTNLLRAGVLTLCAGLLLAGSSPAGAMDSMKGSAMMGDCKSADAMMMHMTMPAMKMSGDADKDFGAMMMAHEKMMLARAKMEVKCGKSASMKAVAQKMIDSYAPMMENLSTAIHTP